MKNLNGKNILITGSNGFLGKAITKELDRLKIEYSGVCSSKYDLINPASVKKLFEDKKPDVIFHLAADCGGIAYNIKSPADLSYNNLMMSLNIFKNAITFGNPKIIMIGSVDSYPGEANIPYSETDLWKDFPEETSAYYGLAKRMNIALGEAYYKQYNLESTHILLMNLYGPNDHFDEFRGHVIPAIIKKIDNAKINKLTSIDIYGDGSPIREFVYVDDAAKLIIQASTIDGFEYFNLRSGQLMKIWDVLETIKSEIKFDGDFVKDMAKPMGHPIKQFDLSKMKSLLGEFKYTPFSEGITKTVEWFYTNVKNNNAL